MPLCKAALETRLLSLTKAIRVEIIRLLLSKILLFFLLLRSSLRSSISHLIAFAFHACAAIRVAIRLSLRGLALHGRQIISNILIIKWLEQCGRQQFHHILHEYILHLSWQSIDYLTLCEMRE